MPCYLFFYSMTTLDDNRRGILAEKLPNYPNIESGSGTLSLRKGISTSINVRNTIILLCFVTRSQSFTHSQAKLFILLALTCLRHHIRRPDIIASKHTHPFEPGMVCSLLMVTMRQT